MDLYNILSINGIDISEIISGGGSEYITSYNSNHLFMYNLTGTVSNLNTSTDKLILNGIYDFSNNSLTLTNEIIMKCENFVNNNIYKSLITLTFQNEISTYNYLMRNNHIINVNNNFSNNTLKVFYDGLFVGNACDTFNINAIKFINNNIDVEGGIFNINANIFDCNELAYCNELNITCYSILSSHYMYNIINLNFNVDILSNANVICNNISSMNFTVRIYDNANFGYECPFDNITHFNVYVRSCSDLYVNTFTDMNITIDGIIHWCSFNEGNILNLQHFAEYTSDFVDYVYLSNIQNINLNVDKCLGFIIDDCKNLNITCNYLLDYTLIDNTTAFNSFKNINNCNIYIDKMIGTYTDLTYFTTISNSSTIINTSHIYYNSHLFYTNFPLFVSCHDVSININEGVGFIMFIDCDNITFNVNKISATYKNNLNQEKTGSISLMIYKAKHVNLLIYDTNLTYKYISMN